MILALLQKGLERAIDNVHTAIYEATERPAVRTFFIEGADELPVKQIYKFPKSQAARQDLVRHLIKLSNFIVPVACLVSRQVEGAVAREAKFR